MQMSASFSFSQIIYIMPHLRRKANSYGNNRRFGQIQRKDRAYSIFLVADVRPFFALIFQLLLITAAQKLH